MTQAMPRLSVIMPCYNTVEYTLQAVQSILKHTTDYELIVVNDGSTDETHDYFSGVRRKTKELNVPFHYINNKESAGFTVACNQGAEVAKGEYLCFVNNDIVVTPFWADRMIFCLEHMEDKFPIGRFGITGPTSNYAAGMQLVPELANKPFDLNFLDSFADDWHKNNQQNWIYAGFLSGFCIMFLRECWEDVGGFDPRFTPGGFEDNDVCNQAFRKGWKSVITGDTFVYHHGTKSTSLPERRFMNGGLHNRGKYFQKYWEKDADVDYPIVAGYRVKDGDAWMEETLSKTLKCVDHVCILDDGSTDKTPEIINTLTVSNPGMITYKRYDRPFQELRDRNELWQMMMAASKKINPDVWGWGLIIDADEVLEDRVTKEYLKYLTKPCHPSIHGYVFKVTTFWRGRQKFRADGEFGALRGVRFVRMTDDQRLWTDHPQGLHCGNVPTVPTDGLAAVNLRLKHYGFENYGLCQKKYDFYQKVDTRKDPKSVGGDGSYRHLIDESQISLIPWRENNSLGLAILGRNEGNLIPSFFERSYFFSLFDQIVYVDCASEDNSKMLAQAYGAEVYDLPDNLIFQDGPFKGRTNHFGKARNFVKSKMKTDWILRMDCDEYIDSAFYPALLRLLEADVHTFRFAVHNWQQDGSSSHSEAMRLYRNDPHLFYTQHVHESLETSVNRLGQSAKVLKAPFPIHHAGYLKHEKYVQLKLEHYEKLNEMDMEHDVTDARPLFNLALHYENEDDIEKALEYLEKAVELKPDFMQAQQEVGIIHLRKARLFYERALQLCPEDHPKHTMLKEGVEWLAKWAPGPVIVGTKNKPKDWEEVKQLHQETEELNVVYGDNSGESKDGPDEPVKPKSDDEAAGGC